jgi:anti-sigma B factor antagonist
VVTAAGEVDLTNADGLRDALLSALNASALGLVVDMTEATFVDSAGVTALVRASRRASASDATMRLAVTSPPVLRVLSLVGPPWIRLGAGPSHPHRPGCRLLAYGEARDERRSRQTGQDGPLARPRTSFPGERRCVRFARV